EQPQDLELGFKLVGHAVDGKVGLAHGVFDAGDEADCFPGALAGSFGAEFAAQGFARMLEVGGQNIFERYTKAGAGGPPGEPAPQRAGSDDGYGERQSGTYLVLRAAITSSALGCDCTR